MFSTMRNRGGAAEGIRVLAWGCGLASTTLGVMSAVGDLEPVDAIVHADTGFETAETTYVREWYTDWYYSHSIPVEVVTAGNIREQGGGRHIHIPFWTDSGGCLKRECTRHFKVLPGKRAARRLLGYHPVDPPHPPAGAIETWLGLTLDEWKRRKESRVQFRVNRYPLIERGMTRQDCVDYLTTRGLPVPPKSACVCCPYRRPSEWLYMRDNLPDDWRAAVEFDEKHRHNPLPGSTASSLYIYKYGGPLAQADLAGDANREHSDDGFQVPLSMMFFPA